MCSIVQLANLLLRNNVERIILSKYKISGVKYKIQFAGTTFSKCVEMNITIRKNSTSRRFMGRKFPIQNIFPKELMMLYELAEVSRVSKCCICENNR